MGLREPASNYSESTHELKAKLDFCFSLLLVSGGVQPKAWGMLGKCSVSHCAPATPFIHDCHMGSETALSLQGHSRRLSQVQMVTPGLAYAGKGVGVIRWLTHTLKLCSC